MRIIPMTRHEVYSELFRHARPDALIALGNLRASSTVHARGTEGNADDKAPRPLTVTRPDTASDTADTLHESGNEPHFIRWNLFGLGVLHPDERADIDGAIRSRLDGLVNHGKPRHIFARAYNLAELAAINVDLDVGTRKDGRRFVTADTALAAINGMVQRGSLPAPSMVGFSGQGLYILYALIKEEETPEPKALPPASPEARLRFKQATEGIIRRCLRVSRRFIPDGYPATLNPDQSSKSPVQWFKNPDSLHPKTGEPVRYYRYAVNDSGHEIRRYTLKELLKWRPGGKSGAEMKPISWYGDGLINDLFAEAEGTLKPRRKYTSYEGQTATPFIRRLEDLERLAKHRGRISEGKRGLWAAIVFNTFRDALIRGKFQGDHDRARSEATKAAIRFSNQYFDPPLPTLDIRHEARRRRDYKNTTLVRLLDVDYQEAIKAGLLFIIPDRLKLEREAERKAQAPTARKQQRNQSMIDDFNSGLTVKAISIKYQLSEGRVWTLKRGFREDELLS